MQGRKKILNEEIETGDLIRFKRFKKWAKENLLGLSAIAITIGGRVTTVEIGARGALRKGAKALGSFGKGIAKVIEKVGPLVSAVLGLAAKVLGLVARGVTFLANNLWILVVAIVAILIEKYTHKNEQ